jgi:hypothetical protein
MIARIQTDDAQDALEVVVSIVFDLNPAALRSMVN